MTTMRLAHREATRKPVREIATELQDALGQRLVAYGCAIRSPKLVGRWATGEHDPRDDAAARLRMLYRVYFLLREDGEYDDATIRAFLLGSNPDLDDETPIDRIRDGHGTDAVRAGQAFLI